MDELHSPTMASRGSFYQLPDEMLLKIFSYLDIPNLVLNIQHVDSHWKAVVQDISFWKEYVFTFGKKMTDTEILLLLKDMPELRALVAKRGTTNKVIDTVCKTCKFLIRLEIHQTHKFNTSHLETIAKHLPHIQHLAFPLSWKESQNAMKYSMLIQQFHELLSLRLAGHAFEANDCFFLKGIADECPQLHEIDLQGHEFQVEDVILFLEAKKNVISQFFGPRTNSNNIFSCLCNCKCLQTLHVTCHGEMFSNMPILDMPYLKDLGIKEYNEESFSIILRNIQKTTMSQLVKLDLHSCSLSGVQFETILTNCKNLKSLALNFFYLPNDDDFEHIGKCAHLENVEAPHCTITDAAVEIFSAKCKKLKYLDISYSPMITDFGFECLMNCNELQVLKLNGTNITGWNFHLIPLHLTRLCELHIEDCYRLDLQYVQLLQEDMQQLRVYATRKTSSDDLLDLTETNIFSELL